MKIAVCIKEVPDKESGFKLNQERTTYEESGLNFVVNEYDLYAMEEAVRIKERFKDVEITVVSVGPLRAEKAIRKALALGGDYGVLIDDSKSPCEDSLSVASLIASWAEDKEFDLILCGLMSEDFQRYQTGPMLAQLLKIPFATAVISLNIYPEKKKLTCERELEGGLREKVELPLPALLTVQTGINTVRYASLSNVLRAKELKIELISSESLGAIQRCERTIRAYLAEPSSSCEFLEGELDEVAEKLLERIRAKLSIS